MEKCHGLSVIMISALRENCPAQASLTQSQGKKENEREEKLEERDAFPETCNVHRQDGMKSQIYTLKVGPGQPINTEVMDTEFIISPVTDCH